MKRIKTPSIIQPNRRKLLLILSLLLVMLSWLGWQIFDYGRVQGGFERDLVEQKTQQYMGEITEQQQIAAEFRAQVARYRREAQVEHEAGRGLQLELIELRKDGGELRNEVALLRSLISTKRGSLYIKRFEIHPTETMGRYRYQLIVAQALDNVGTTRGKLGISILGKLDGKSKRLELKQFSEDAVASIALEFKHYQEVNGTISLEEGFEPESVEMEVKPKNKKLSKMNEQFSWQVKNTRGDGQEETDEGT
jgi:hypothetical protein